MWEKTYREALWSDIQRSWNLIVIGGGITGAGVLRQARAAGLNCLLLEANDFSSGTSSRSSKLVHGGFRYMRSRQFDVTRESVREREWLLKAAQGLVSVLPFMMPNFEPYHTPNWQFAVGVALYDLFGYKWQHRRYTPRQALKIIPQFNPNGLKRVFRYNDAAVDDSRLVLRVLFEACQAGAHALNYARVEGLLRDARGQVRGVTVRDVSIPGGPTAEINADAVINATGPYTDHIRMPLGVLPRIRQTRGSHLIFPREKLPLEQAVSLMHPVDHRAMFAIPWESVCLVGTTDLDHEQSAAEPYTSLEEIDYILQALNNVLPGFHLGQQDVIATYAGVRPIVSRGLSDPSAESRAHEVWEEEGLFTITGGKLTTFRVMADSVLSAARSRFSGRVPGNSRRTMFDPLPTPPVNQRLDPRQTAYLGARYAGTLPDLLGCPEDEFTPIAGSPNLWAELRLAARAEGVVHLDDLLLRRVRIGLQLPHGGQNLLPRIKTIAQTELGWSAARWEQEAARYADIWRRYYSPAPEVEIPAEVGPALEPAAL